MIFATNNAKFYIGGVVALSGTDLTEASFTGQAWVEIGETENLGTVGDTTTEITFDGINSNRTRRLKGTRNAGTMELVCGLDYSDAGQLALLAAEKSRYDYAFRLVLDDAPPGGTPSERLFAAAVGSAAEAMDAANNILKLNASLWVNSNVVRINATNSGSAPDNTVRPSISGTAEEGETLTGAAGTWTGSPSPTLSYQWLADGETIPGATTTSLVLAAGHVGKKIAFAVTAVNPLGTRLAVSAETATVT